MRSEELIVMKAQINLFSMTACNLMGLNDLYPELCLLSPTAYCLLAACCLLLSPLLSQGEGLDSQHGRAEGGAAAGGNDGQGGQARF